MRLVAWNCRSGFHRKIEALCQLAPDVAIIAECCSLRLLARRAPELTATSALWIGDNPNKGLGVFSFGSSRLVRDEAYDPSIRYALPVRVENSSSQQGAFHLLAVWAHYGLSGMRVSTVGPTLQALAAYQQFLLAKPSIVAGDFNNHVRWDRPGKAWNHANSVETFERLGFISAYHVFEGLRQGDERHPTFYWRSRSATGPTYHIDYAFMPRTTIRYLRSLVVGSREDWIATGLSDHAPLIVDLDSAFAASSQPGSGFSLAPSTVFESKEADDAAL